MDISLLRYATHLPADNPLTWRARVTLIELAALRFDARADCTPSIDTIAGHLNLSRDTVERGIAELETQGRLTRQARKINGLKISNLYAIITDRADAGKSGNDTADNGNARKTRRKEKPTEKAARDTANSGVNSDDVFSDGGKPITEKSLADDCGVPLAFVKDRLAEWKRDGWITTQGKAITRRTVRAHLRAWWKHEKNQERYEKPTGGNATPKKYTAKDWTLCRERCAHCTAHGCGKGVTDPPDAGAFPIPPEECRQFAPLTMAGKRKNGKRA